jgi:hypothetical protein
MSGERIVVAIIDTLGISKELTVEFIGTFARFEYALKRAGYVSGDDRSARADWDRFGDYLAGLSPEMLAPVLASCMYLQSRPPLKQVLDKGRLVWRERGSAGGDAIEEALLSIRTVRNNLFHGGKFPEGRVEEPLRDEQLIRDCLAVFDLLLHLPSLPDGIADYFWSEA